MEAARPATEDDLGRLADLAADAAGELGAMRGGAVFCAREARPVPARASLEAVLHDPAQLLVAGTIDGVVVGYAAAHLDTLRDGSTLGIIDDLFVEPGARDVGVGEEMIDRVLAWCRDRGCAGVDAMALPGNRDTKNFFESFGFTARAIVVHHRLDRAAEA